MISCPSNCNLNVQHDSDNVPCNSVIYTPPGVLASPHGVLVSLSGSMRSLTKSDHMAPKVDDYVILHSDFSFTLCGSEQSPSESEHSLTKKQVWSKIPCGSARSPRESEHSLTKKQVRNKSSKVRADPHRSEHICTRVPDLLHCRTTQ